VKKKTPMLISAISNWLALAVNIAVGFFLTPYIIQKLGLSYYGIWALINSIVGYYGLLDLGVSSAVMRYIARYAGQNNIEAMNKVINTAIIIFTFIGCLLVFLSIFAVDPLSVFFNIKNYDYNAFKTCIWLLGISAGLLLPGNVLQISLAAHENFLLRNIIEIITASLRALLIVFVLSNDGGLVEISFANFISVFLKIFLYWLMIKINFKHILLSLKLFEKKMAMTLLSFGLFASIGQLGILLKTKLDALVIGHYLGTEDIGIYSVPVLLTGYLLRFNGTFSSIFQPRLAALAGESDLTDFRKSLINYSAIVSFISAISALAAFILCEDFLRLWTPDNFTKIDEAIKVSYILILVVLLDHMNDVGVNGLRAIKKHKYFAYQSIIEGITNVGLSVALVLYFNMGITGVAFGTLIPTILTKFILQPIYCSYIFQIKWKHYFTNTILKPIIVLGITLIIIHTFQILPVAKNYPALVLKGLITIITFSPLAFFTVLEKDQRFILYKKLIKSIK